MSSKNKKIVLESEYRLYEKASVYIVEMAAIRDISVGRIIAAHSESKVVGRAMLIKVKARSYSPRYALQTESLVFERLFLTAHCKDEVWGLDHPRDISVSGVGWHVGVTILLLLIEAKPQCFFTEAETEYLTKRIQDGRPDVVKVNRINSLYKKSTSGTFQLLGGKLVSWSAKKQQYVAMSSAEAKYVAAARCFLHSRTKHIDIRYHFIMDRIIKGDIELHFIPTQYQRDDIFTKPLKESTFKRLIVELGKAIVTSSAPTYDPEPDMVTKDEEMSKEKEIDKLMALISLSFKKIYKPTNNNLRTSSNTSRANQDNSPRINRGTGYDNQRAVNVVGARENVGTPVVQKSGIQCYNCKEYGHVSRECQKPKRVKDAAYHKEKMLLCKQEEAGVQLNAEQADWKDDIDDESDDQELEAHYMYMHKFKRDQDDQDETDDLDQERDLLASLIQKLKCEIDDSKNRNKFLESSNKALVDKLKGEIEGFKTKNKSLESSNNHFKEANNKLSKNNQLMFKDLKKFQAELDKYNDVNYASKVKIDCANVTPSNLSTQRNVEYPRALLYGSIAQDIF
ncbi:reverse transcriptase domain-containing protein [Tanacetum coccineum]